MSINKNERLMIHNGSSRGDCERRGSSINQMFMKIQRARAVGPAKAAAEGRLRTKLFLYSSFAIFSLYHHVMIVFKQCTISCCEWDQGVYPGYGLVKIIDMYASCT